MTNPTVIQTSLDPEEGAAGAGRRPSIAARIGVMGQNRIGALLLLGTTLAAIIWANVSLGSYQTFWQTHLMVGIGDLHLDFTLHALVNDALMAIFFFTVGLEVRREFAIGELTSWSRALVPVAAAIAGLVVPALLFVLIARGSGNEQAWGAVISSDTAFLVGALALIGPRVPGRLRVFLLALAVVDDIGALSIIALVYTEHFTPLPLLIAAVGLAGVYFTRYLPSGRGPVYASLAIVVWLAFLASGVHPTLAGVAIALLVPAYRPNRGDVERALPDLGRRAPRRRLRSDARAPGRPGTRPRAREPVRSLHDRRVWRLPVRLLPQGVRLDPGGARRTRRPAPLRLAPRAARADPPQRPRGRGGDGGGGGTGRILRLRARSSTTRTTSGRPTSSGSPTIWAWTSSGSRRTSSRPRSPAGCATTCSTPRP